MAYLVWRVILALAKDAANGDGSDASKDLCADAVDFRIRVRRLWLRSGHLLHVVQPAYDCAAICDCKAIRHLKPD